MKRTAVVATIAVLLLLPSTSVVVTYLLPKGAALTTPLAASEADVEGLMMSAQPYDPDLRPVPSQDSGAGGAPRLGGGGMLSVGLGAQVGRIDLALLTTLAGCLRSG